MTIKYVNHNKDYKLSKHGNWTDLAVSKTYEMAYLEHQLLDLGISMKLPKWYKAELKPRSSTFQKFSIIMTNSVGEIDTEYCGHNDRWKFSALSLNRSYTGYYVNTFIKKNSRIAQFTIKLREDAPWYIKIKDLFTNYKFKEVDVLTDTNRGGFGSTGN